MGDKYNSRSPELYQGHDDFSLDYSDVDIIPDTPELSISASIQDDSQKTSGAQGMATSNNRVHPGDIDKMAVMEVDEYAEFEAWLGSGCVEIV